MESWAGPGDHPLPLPPHTGGEMHSELVAEEEWILMCPFSSSIFTPVYSTFSLL